MDWNRLSVMQGPVYIPPANNTIQQLKNKPYINEWQGNSVKICT